MGTQKAGFVGIIKRADCHCHKGLFVVDVFLLDPIEQEAHLIDQVFFKTETEAKMKMVDVVRESAAIYLENAGVEIDSIVETEQAVGNEADKMADNFMREQNPNLH